jgi:long-chain fatty acid transport protein
MTQSWRDEMRLLRRWLLVCIASSTPLMARDAAASPLFELGGSVGDRGGLQGRTVGGGPSSAYYNPALLVEADAGLSFGVFTLATDININYAARLGSQYDVPNLGPATPTYPGGAALPSSPLPTSVLQAGAPASGGSAAVAPRPRGAAGTGHQTFTYQMIGLVAKLLDGRLALGLYALIPINGPFTTAEAFYPDEREQYFSNSLHPELYGDRLTALSFAFGLGYKVSDELSLGAGATLSLSNSGGSPVFVANAANLQNLLIDSDIRVLTSISPHFGVSYKPVPRWRLTATAHAPEKFQINDNFTFTLAGGQGQESGITFVHDYMPWQFGLGTSFDVIQAQHDTFTVALTGVCALWSTYEDRHGQTPEEESGGVPAYNWYNTLSPTAGLRFQHDDVGTFLDGTYVPSPVPLQTGRSDYVDNDRVGFDTGADYTFTLFHLGMRVGAQLQVQRLIPRTQSKLRTPSESDGYDNYPALVRDELPDNSVIQNSVTGATGAVGAAAQGLQTNNPGWPGFGSDGWVLGGGVYLAVIP